MKILSIGNSFSQDAHKWLKPIAKLCGEDFYNVNLYVSGCSLEMHHEYIDGNIPNYIHEVCGNIEGPYISVAQALKDEDWDIITVQQVSQLSGKPESYEPHLTVLLDTIRAACPRAKIYLHQTWAYEMDSTYSGFRHYNNDQTQMYECIVRTTEDVAKRIGAPLIPAGRLIQTLRTDVPEFDYANGGLSLNRDGFHLTWDYGRFAVAALWVRVLTGKQVNLTEFEDFDNTLVQKILKVVNEMDI